MSSSGRPTADMLKIMLMLMMMMLMMTMSNSVPLILFSRVAEDSDMADQSFRLAVCIPKACSTRHAINSLYINTTAVGLEFTDDFCRLKNDKPFVPADYVAM